MKRAIKSKAMIAIVLIAIAVTATWGAVCSASSANENNKNTYTVTYKDWASGETLAVETVAAYATPSMTIGGEAYAVKNLLTPAVEELTVYDSSLIDFERYCLTGDLFTPLAENQYAEAIGRYEKYEARLIDRDPNKTAELLPNGAVGEDSYASIDNVMEAIICESVGNSGDLKISEMAFIKLNEAEEGVFTKFFTDPNTSQGDCLQCNYFGKSKLRSVLQMNAGGVGAVGDSYFLAMSFPLDADYFAPHEVNKIAPEVIYSTIKTSAGGVSSEYDYTVLYACAPIIVNRDMTMYVEKAADPTPDDPNGGEMNPPNGGDDPRPTPTPTDQTETGWTMAKKIGIGLGCAVGAVIVISGIALMVNTRKRKNTRKSRSRR